MFEFKKEEKIGLLKRALKRRIDGIGEYEENLKTNLKKIEKVKLTLEEKIEQYKDDDIIVRMLEAQLAEHEKNYGSTKTEINRDLEEAKETYPTVEAFYDLLENKKYDEETLLFMIDLFLKPILNDWHGLEESENESEEDVQES
mgnify:CR=1 FL=1